MDRTIENKTEKSVRNDNNRKQTEKNVHSDNNRKQKEKYTLFSTYYRFQEYVSAYFFPVLMTLAWLVVVASSIRNIVYDKEKRLEEVSVQDYRSITHHGLRGKRV